MWEDCCARALVAAGGTADDVCQVCYGYGLFTGGAGLHGGSHRLGSLTLPMSSGNTDRQIQFMMDLESTILCCTPSYAAYIGESLKEQGFKPEDNKLKAGIFGAEPWTEEMRHEIEKSLGIKAYDIYGLTETSGPGVAFECEEQKGMHINEDHFYAEIIDPDTGEVLPEGSVGELVFTALDKEAFPLLRYRTRDLCVLNRTPCSCGRTHVRMAKPMGRSDDMLIIRGVNVFPSQIETVLLNEGYTRWRRGLSPPCAQCLVSDPRSTWLPPRPLPAAKVKPSASSTNANSTDIIRYSHINQCYISHSSFPNVILSEAVGGVEESPPADTFLQPLSFHSGMGPYNNSEL